MMETQLAKTPQVVRLLRALRKHADEGIWLRKLAREAEIAYALICLPSDYDCWRPHPGELDKHGLLKEIMANVTEATKHAVDLTKAAVERFGEIAEVSSPAHSALELAIWSDRQKIPPEARQKLGVLVEKYL